MKQSEWTEIAAVIGEIWPRDPLPTRTVTAWYPLLADLPGDAVREGVAALAMQPDRRFPPSVGEVRGASEPPLRDPGDALAELFGVVARLGRYVEARPTFADPALESLVAERGWGALCDADLRDSTQRAQLRDDYAAAQRRHRAGQRRATARALVSGGQPALRALPGGAA